MDRNLVQYRLTPGDISAIRFGVSPGMELIGAVRVLLAPEHHPLHWGWVRSVRDVVPTAPLALLGAVIGRTGYMPDFLTSTPGWDLAPATELARLRAVGENEVRKDLVKMEHRSTGRRRELIRGLVAEPARARAAIADAWEEVWATVMEPHWPQLDGLLRADIGTRARRVGEHGLAAMVSTLHEAVAWSPDAVEVTMRTHNEVVDCTGTGLLLVPSVFLRRCAAVTELPAHPMLFYPAHGVSETWTRRDADALSALSALCGPGRARVLMSLAEPLSTTEAANACRMAASTASYHLTVLRQAGLVTSSRTAHVMLHARTPMGDALVSAPTRQA